jgi:Programmed cell death protein 2, C-terminal putative domain
MAQLGYIDLNARSNSMYGDPQDTKIGGFPTLYENQVFPPSFITCPHCSNSLYLLIQVYAPLEFDRTLYVFGCNSQVCFKNKGKPSIVVYRSQRSSLSSTSSSIESKPNPAITLPASFSSDSWGDGGAWGSSEFDEGASTTDTNSSAVDQASASLIESMKRLESEKKESSKKVSRRDDSPDEKRTQLKAVFPCFPVISYDNDFDSNSIDAEDAEELEESGGLHAEDVSSSQQTSKYYKKGISKRKQIEDEHVSKLLSSYQAWEKSEEERRSASSNPESHSIPPEVKDDEGEDEETEVGSDFNVAASTELSSGGEKYERVPEKLRFMLAFQDKLQQLPAQVLRYEYEGEPVWPAPPSVVASGLTASVKGKAKVPVRTSAEFERVCVPACESCGATRKFEFQTMPPLLSFLNVDENTVEGTQAIASRGDQIMLGGMDWSSVLVYSCSKSCDGSLRTEFAVVIDAI